jgi:hypothetical protein
MSGKPPRPNLLREFDRALPAGLDSDAPLAHVGELARGQRRGRNVLPVRMLNRMGQSVQHAVDCKM